MRSRSRRCCATLLCAASLGCGSPGAFECQSDAQCGDGRCEPTGWCSFPDDACNSGSRYGGLAGGGLAGECVPVGETETGGSDGPSTGPDASSVTTPSMGEPTSPVTADTATSDPGTSSDETPTSCGDGTVDADEDCDDGDAVDGNGCDSDCTPSGETIWEYVSNIGGTDIARDVLVLEDGSVAVCGDGFVADVGAPLAALFSAEGDLLALAEIEGVGPGNAWGIAGSSEFVVLGGRRLGPGINDGFVVTQSVIDMQPVVFEVPMAVYDVAFDGEIIWVSGQLGGAPSVAAYRIEGVPYEGFDPMDALPVTGVAWDLAVDRGAVHVAGIDDQNGAAWIGSVAIDSGLAWSTTWNMGGVGAAFGITHAFDGSLIASGSAEASGMIAVLERRNGAERWSAELEFEKGPFANIHKAAGGPSGEVVGVGWVATSTTDADIWVGKYSAEGDLLWERRFAGTGTGIDSNGWSVAVDGAGFITAVGGIFNEATEYDSWVVHLEP